MTEKTAPTGTAGPTAPYTDTRMIKIGVGEGAMEFHGYSVTEVKNFMTFLAGLQSNADAMVGTFAPRPGDLQ
jgi:hypothetical protein